ASSQASSQRPAAATEKSLVDSEWESLRETVKSSHSRSETSEAGKDILVKFPWLRPEQTAELLQLMEGSCGSYSTEFLSDLARQLSAKLKSLTSSQLALLLSAFLAWPAEGRLRFGEAARDFVSAVTVDVPSRLMELAPHELNCCLASLVSLGCNDQKFFVAVGRSALARHKTFGPKELTALLTILSEARLVHSDLFTSSASVIATRVRELRAVDILRAAR
ncbi:unnamed protein product, partial [Polarella glacialis]